MDDYRDNYEDELTNYFCPIKNSNCYEYTCQGYEIEKEFIKEYEELRSN